MRLRRLDTGVARRIELSRFRPTVPQKHPRPRCSRDTRSQARRGCVPSRSDGAAGAISGIALSKTATRGTRNTWAPRPLADQTLSAALGRIKEAAFDYYPRLQKVKNFAISRLSSRISLRDVAEVASYETTYFCALFHRRVGVSFSEWLTLVRVTKATELLRSRDYPIQEVAHAVGF